MKYFAKLLRTCWEFKEENNLDNEEMGEILENMKNHYRGKDENLKRKNNLQEIKKICQKIKNTARDNTNIHDNNYDRGVAWMAGYIIGKIEELGGES